MDSRQRKDVARTIFLQALAATTVAAAVETTVRCDGRTLQVGDASYALDAYGEVIFLSIGKAGAELFDTVDALLPETVRRRSVVCAPVAPVRGGAGVAYFCGGHPEPNAASFAAAAAALELLHEAEAEALIVFLISGGASAMCELPLEDSVTLEDVVELNHLLIGSGASIAEVNAVRKHLSAVKGGRLARAAGRREKLTLLISDVPGGALDAVGSGPSLPDATSVADCLAVLKRYGLMEALPAAIRAMVTRGLPETLKPGDAIFTNARAVTLLDSQAFLAQAARLASELGYTVVIDNSCDDWPCEKAAAYLLQRLQTLRSSHSGKVCLLSGGEVTVRLPSDAGRGGRNQHLCLQCVALGLPEGVTVLSAGTDGVDGNSPAAGAVVDSTTAQQATDAGFHVSEHLRGCNAFPLLEALGDAILTGPTGNNLRDVRILLGECFT